jgi:hypothetical protein
MNVQSPLNIRSSVTLAGFDFTLMTRKIGSIEAGAGGTPVPISHKRL